MLDQQSQIKLKKVLIIFLSCVLIILVCVVFLKDSNNGDDAYVSPIAENMLTMNGVSIVYVMDNNSHVNLYSDSAFADRQSNVVEMAKVSMEYNGGSMKINAMADNGKYELQRILTVYGNIQGRMNDLDFVAGDNGTLVYDYEAGNGKVNNGITVRQGQNNITAEIADFNIKDSYILFRDNVSVEYLTATP